MGNATATKELDKNVWEASKERAHEIYEDFDKVFVSFSGGKDSTAVLKVLEEVHKERDRDERLEVWCADEEIILPETAEYMKRVASRDHIDFHRVVQPLKFGSVVPPVDRNWWMPWNPNKQDKWVRDIPENAEFPMGRPDEELYEITNDRYVPAEEFDHETLVDPKNKGKVKYHAKPAAEFYYKDYTSGKLAACTGLRTHESIQRRLGIMSSKDYVAGNFGWTRSGHDNQFHVRPIYDWKTKDIYVAMQRFDWDYNHAYDKFQKLGIPWSRSRVAPPYHKEASKDLSVWKNAWKDMWTKMCKRNPGLNMVARYGHQIYNKPMRKEDETWQEATQRYLQDLEPEMRKKTKGEIDTLIQTHKKKSSLPLFPEKECSRCGMSWKKFAELAKNGIHSERDTLG